MFRFLTAGESHGPGLVSIVEGMPAGVEISSKHINEELSRRQAGFGRGGRMRIEKDQVEIISGVRSGRTLGTPLALLIRNKDWKNWQEVMNIEEESKAPSVICPRPGHADLAGIIKTGQPDIRNVLERSSARETAARVAVGTLCKKLLAEIGISILSYVLRIGAVEVDLRDPLDFSEKERIDASPVRCPYEKESLQMVEEIKKAQAQNDTLGGIFEVIVWGVPPGLGSYTSWDRRLDGRLAQAAMSIPAIKGVEIGKGFKLAEKHGSEAHDEIFYEREQGYFRKTNRAGGIEGGMSNGQPLVLRAAMKPIPTLGKPLRTVNIETKEPAKAFKERADICAVPSAAVIGEAVVAIELCSLALEKFGGDSLKEFKSNYENYVKSTREM